MESNEGQWHGSLCPNCCYPLNSLSFSASVSITTSLRTCWSPACRAAWSWCVLSAHLRYCSIVQVTNSHLGPGSPQHLSQKRKLHLRCVENAAKCPVQTLMTEFNLYFYNLLHSYKMLQGQTAACMRTWTGMVEFAKTLSTEPYNSSSHLHAPCTEEFCQPSACFGKNTVTRHSRQAAHHRWFPRLLNVLPLTVWIQIVLEAIGIAKFPCQWEAKVNIRLLKLLTLYRHYWQSSKFQSFCCSWFCRACCRLSRLFSNLRSGAEREETIDEMRKPIVCMMILNNTVNAYLWLPDDLIPIPTIHQ